MMYMPALFEDDFDTMMNEFDREFNHEMNKKTPLFGRHADRLMKTDVRELDNAYELDIDLPGFKKEDLTVGLKDGYLTISAEKGMNKDEKNKAGKLIRQERYAGSLERSFYVGDDLKQEDIKAHYENGVLKITMPKPADTKAAVDEKSRIATE